MILGSLRNHKRILDILLVFSAIEGATATWLNFERCSVTYETEIQRMDIEQLRYFLKVAEHANFTRAADDIGISQPALSRSVARLEEELGQPVFERQTRKLVLTEAGVLLESRAQQILMLVEDTKAEITDDGQSGRVRVAAIPTIAPYFLPTVLREFSDAYPKASVTVQEDTTVQLLKSITDGVVAVAVLALPLDIKYLEIEDLFEEELLLVLPPEHPLVNKKNIRMADVAPLPFVLLSEAHCLSDNIVTFCRQKSFNPVSMERTSQLATVQELVSLGHGISMIPQMAVSLDKGERRVYRSLVAPRPTRKIVVVWNPYRFQSKLVKAFLRVLHAKSRS